MHEIFNDPNVLPPGNAGSSFTVPKYKDQSKTILDTWNWINAPFGEETQPIYKLVELPYQNNLLMQGMHFCMVDFWEKNMDMYTENPHPDTTATQAQNMKISSRIKLLVQLTIQAPMLEKTALERSIPLLGLSIKTPVGSAQLITASPSGIQHTYLA